MMATTQLGANINNNSKYFLYPQAGPSPPEQFLYGQNNPMGTQSTTPPSNNISPTNYHTSANPPQLRRARGPMYVPAALRPSDRTRPTDIPSRPRAPDTPPASNESSFDIAKADSPAAIEFAGFQFGQGDDVESMRQGLSRAASETLSLEELGDVTGTPTTAHWKPDESATSCFICKESFTWFFRRHHCRRCGNLVCDYHIKYNIPLDQNARIHPKGFLSKSCNTCFDDWKIIKKLHHSRASSIAESSGSSQGTAMPIPRLQPPQEDMRIGSMARSEGGMVWSTF
ncbi:FYVE-type zinc finger-containing protein C9B6.03 [Pseudocercospora fuligena]|uniref:FYVE-type zinc finger-containing protein C9B6.03 n=1 Tax=Pseudocercospora fuligena TaxID=685502 RepID=A0A8H6RGR1_9PEZI|nr:FYVE-type zinc finger-containing protein C9B6.03 [Pseudocercospora fuligena]